MQPYYDIEEIRQMVGMTPAAVYIKIRLDGIPCEKRLSLRTGRRVKTVLHRDCVSYGLLNTLDAPTNHDPHIDVTYGKEDHNDADNR